MIEFELPPADPSEPPEPFALDFTSLLGSPLSRWNRGIDFGPFPPPVADASDAAVPSYRPSNAAVGESTPLFTRQPAPQAPPEPSWKAVVDAIEAVHAQRAVGFGIAPPPQSILGNPKYAMGLPTARTSVPTNDHEFVRVSNDGPTVRKDNVQLAQQQHAQQLRPIPARGVAPDVEPPPNSPELEKAFQDWGGRLVRLPDGSPIPDPYAPNGYLMSPFADLRDVAEAGKKAGPKIVWSLALPPPLALESLIKILGNALGHGGAFDYQRRRFKFGRDGFTQLRQFRSVSNFNVGLFCQRAGIPLTVTLAISGFFAFVNTKNFKPSEPYGLDPPTKYFIELGYLTGESGAF